MNNNEKKIIIFDMDGVLVNSIQLAGQALISGYPGLTEEMRMEMLCGNFHDEIKKISHLKKTENEEDKNLRQLQYAKIKSKAPLYDGVREFLKELYSLKYILILNTSAYERNCLPILIKTKIIKYFDFIADADLSKSKIEKFKLIEAKYKINKKNILFVTDTLGDLREADKAKISTVAVTWGAHNESYFKREPHSNLIGIINALEELKEFI